jgi:DNA-binding transcriptional LysR family regulator
VKSDELHALDLNKLMTALVIAEAGGVTPAARRLGLTRSAISHSLAGLEESLGVSLFHRIGKRLVPTRDGALLLRRLKGIRVRLDSALGEVVGRADEVRGQIRIGFFLGFSRFRLVRLIDGFVRAHPHARVRVAFAPEEWLRGQLLEGRLDFAVSLRPPPEPSRNLESQQLFEHSLVLAMKEFRRGPRPSAEEIAGLPIVDYYQADPLIDRWLEYHYGGPRMPRERIGVYAASTDLAVELVTAGVGAAVLPADVAEAFRRRKELVVVRGPREPLRDAVWLNELRGAGANRAHAAFRQHLVRSLEAPARRRRVPPTNPDRGSPNG